MQDELAAAGLTDGLPVIPPTRERVAHMLKVCQLEPAEVLAVLAPAFDQATWHNVAVNAVMAGCRPEYLPVVGAAIAAKTYRVMDPSFGRDLPCCCGFRQWPWGGDLA